MQMNIQHMVYWRVVPDIDKLFLRFPIVLIWMIYDRLCTQLTLHNRKTERIFNLVDLR